MIFASAWRYSSRPPIEPASFIANCFRASSDYAAMRVPEIADDIVSIDNALKWGFGWQFWVLLNFWDARGERIIDDWVRESGRFPPLWKVYGLRRQIFLQSKRRNRHFLRRRLCRISPAPRTAGRHPWIQRARPFRQWRKTPRLGLRTALAKYRGGVIHWPVRSVSGWRESVRGSQEWSDQS